MTNVTNNPANFLFQCSGYAVYEDNEYYYVLKYTDRDRYMTIYSWRKSHHYPFPVDSCYAMIDDDSPSRFKMQVTNGKIWINTMFSEWWEEAYCIWSHYPIFPVDKENLYIHISTQLNPSTNILNIR